MVRRLRVPFIGLLAAVLIASAACSAAGQATPVASRVPASALPAGTYTSRLFQPAVTYTLPAGWDNPADDATYLTVRPAGSEVAGIHLFRDPLAAAQDAACAQAAEPGIAATSVALAAWIRSRPGLMVSPSKLVMIGGLRGVELDVGIVAGWTASCPFADGSPTVPLFFGSKGEYHWIVVGSERMRLTLLDAPGGGTLVVDIDAFDGTLIDPLVAAAAPIVQGFSFAPR